MVVPVDGYVEVADARLHFLDWGGDGPPLVLVHATGFHAHMWDWYAARLGERFRVIALDQRGHGDSSQPATPIAWAQFPDDLFALIAALGIEGCYAAGHSSGGFAVGVCAGRHPGTIREMVLIDPVLNARRDTSGPGMENPMAARTLRRRSAWESPRQFAAAMASRAAFAHWRPPFIDLYAEYGLRRRPDGHYELKCPPAIEAQVYAQSGSYDPWPALSRITAPTLLIRATAVEGETTVLPVDAATRIPGCREQTSPTTHFIPMEEPELVLAALEGMT